MLGISERAKRLGTEAVFDSAPGVGTTLRIQVAIDQESREAPEFQPNESNAA
jgi:hypothetical protein